MARPGFYRSLGLTKREFYDKVGGRAGRSAERTDPDPNTTPSGHIRHRDHPAARPIDEHTVQAVDGGSLTNAQVHGIIQGKKEKAHRAAGCSRTKKGLSCARCYETAKGR